MAKAKVFILKQRFNGYPKEEDFEIIEENLPPLKDGEFLAEAVYLSVDPYLRAFSAKVPLRSSFAGSQLAIIRESRNSEHPVGQYIIGQFGWRSHTIHNGKGYGFVNTYPTVTVPPSFGDLPRSLALGVLGMPGNSAYFGFMEFCEPKAGETVVVTAAGGAVGSHVGQIAKIMGCKVIGIAGSDEKGKWLTKDLGFDHFINYKIADIDQELSTAAPQGVDCYFDNVGGEISSIVLNHMNDYGRISVCGSISCYNESKMPKVTMVQYPTVVKQLKIQGFMVPRWKDRWVEGIQQNLQWIKEGKLKYRETWTEGFENTHKCFIDMLKGVNFGKALVKA